MKFASGLLIGFGLSWISMYLAIEQYIYKNEEDKKLIDELVTENNGYKKVIQKWRDEADKT